MPTPLKTAEKYIYPLLLLLYPLLLANQGIDITDTTYSLGYYRFMEEMDLTWVLATYLANVAGSLLMKLPLGNTLLGMNLYTSLIVSAIALASYYGLSQWLPRRVVFLGEAIALSLCWCPTTILYNYLTYLLFALGSLLLYRAICGQKDLYFIAAGICLGLNVMVRFSNLAEAGLIVVLWYAGWQGREKLTTIVRKTALCLGGYLAGFCSILLIIGIKYGVGAFGEMIGSLFGMTKEASDYTLAGMVLATADAYGVGLRWMAYMLPCIGAGMLLFMIKKGKWEKAKKVAYCMGIPILLRFYWGQGMFSLRYYNEGAVFQWMMLFLILSVGCCVAELCGFLAAEKAGCGSGASIQRGPSAENGGKAGTTLAEKGAVGGGILPLGEQGKVLAALVLAIILLTPLGSNNYTYQNMNNLFLVAPYTLWACYRIWKKTGSRGLHFPWQAMGALILLMTLVQGIGFGCSYVFRDGIYGEPRDARVENSPVLQGMYTHQGNAGSLSGLIAFWQEEGGTGPVLLWGNAPGLSYILDAPSAIFTTWPEIPSNTYEALDEALESLDWEPAIILHNDTGEPLAEGEKSELILDFMEDRGYACVFRNENYQVYRAE